MSVSIETDLKEILTKIDKKIDKLDQKLDAQVERLEQKIDNVAKDVIELKVFAAKIEEKGIASSREISDLKQQTKEGIDGLATKITNLEGRVNTQLNWFLGVVVVLTGGLLTGLVTVLSKFIPSGGNM